MHPSEKRRCLTVYLYSKQFSFRADVGTPAVSYSAGRRWFAAAGERLARCTSVSLTGRVDERRRNKGKAGAESLLRACS